MAAPKTTWKSAVANLNSIGSVAENGPFTINPDLTLTETAFGWDVGHNLIFVDQPIGTGFSYTTDPADNVYGEAGDSSASVLPAPLKLVI